MKISALLLIALLITPTSYAHEVETMQFDVSNSKEDQADLVFRFHLNCRIGQQSAMILKGAKVFIEGKEEFDFLERYLLLNIDLKPIEIQKSAETLKLNGQGTWTAGSNHIDYPNNIEIEVTGLKPGAYWSTGAKVQMNIDSEYSGMEKSFQWTCDSLSLQLPNPL